MTRWRSWLLLIAALVMASCLSLHARETWRGGTRAPSHPLVSRDRVDASTLAGKMILGFQGWFGCPNDGARLGWWHWFHGTDPAIDMLPDTTDFPPGARCPTPMRDAAGQPIELFSDQNPAAVDVQFAWMQQYGLDGVALQRFATGVLDPLVFHAYERVIANARAAAEAHGRVFLIMYDLSGLRPGDLPRVAADWAHLEQMGITRSPAYQRHRGHPVLGVWGLGFGGRPLTPADAESLLDALERASAPYGGVTFLGGVPSRWRTGQGDASPDPGWNRVWRRLGVLSPWSVGRFRDEAGANAYRHTVIEPDLAATRRLGVDYMPVVFPGFSFSNTRRSFHQPNAIANENPRRCGQFYWWQVHNALSAGATMLYGAMFDEVNEGTAMFKILPTAADLPVQGVAPGVSFVPLDADGCHLPSDWYLRLAGAATKALRRQAPLSREPPLPLPSR